MRFVKLFTLFLGLMYYPASQSLAQATQPTSTTSTNRQQELYDQYHGVNRKATQPTTVATTTTTSRLSPVQAESNSSNVRIGVRGGVTQMFLTKEVALLKPDLGFVGGVTANFGSGLLSLQPEVNYARYGVKFGNTSIGTYKVAFDVIEVPVFLKIASGSYAGHRFFVNVGPYATYLASQSVAGKKVAIDKATNRFAFGAALGLGAALKAGPGHVTIEARGLYALGDQESTLYVDTKVINAQLTAGYVFPIGGR